MDPALEPLIFHHAPQTRSFGTRVLLEELGLPYTVRPLDLKAGANRSPAYLAINPLGKVPAIQDGTALITEQVAITIYLADLAPAAKLAPPLGDALRGPYLRWCALQGSAFEPALIDQANRRDPGQVAMSPYGSFDAVLDLLEVQLAEGPWLFGGRFSAADVLWGTGLGWTLQFGLVPPRAAFTAYAERIQARPAFQKARAADEALMAELSGQRPAETLPT